MYSLSFMLGIWLTGGLRRHRLSMFSSLILVLVSNVLSLFCILLLDLIKSTMYLGLVFPLRDFCLKEIIPRNASCCTVVNVCTLSESDKLCHFLVSRSSVRLISVSIHIVVSVVEGFSVWYIGRFGCCWCSGKRAGILTEIPLWSEIRESS